MSNLPGTAIKLTFINTPPKGYPPLFYEDDSGAGAMASVNAGSSDQLYVGGFGINGGFAKLLAGLQLDAYQTRHEALLAKASGGGSYIETYPDGDPMAFSLVYGDAPTVKLSGAHDGVCFVDVFAPENRPHGVTANAAMLYVAPPNGLYYPNAQAFLAAIRQTASNIAVAMGRYQKVADAHGVPSISVLRLCLFSSSIYNTMKIDSNDIAEEIYGGLYDILKDDDCGLTELQLPVGNSLFDIIQQRT